MLRDWENVFTTLKVKLHESWSSQLARNNPRFCSTKHLLYATSIAANYMYDFDTSMNFTHFSCAAWRASWKGQHWRNEVAYYLLLSKAASKKLICGKLKTTENLILLISSSDVKIQLPLNLVLIISSIWIFKHSHIFMVEGRPLDIFNIQCTAWHNFCRQVFNNVPYLFK